jgi:hypothetical protein
MARRPATVISNGHNQIRWPGAHAYALERKCHRDAMIAAADFLTLADEDVAAWHRDNAERKAALMEERAGQTIRVHADMLPPGMPSPLFVYPRDGIDRGMFSITPEDLVTFKPRGMRWVS